MMALMACDDEIIPLQERIETVAGVYDIERHLLYVACTRARDHLLLTGVAPVSEFLDDFTKAADRSCCRYCRLAGDPRGTAMTATDLR